MSLKLSDFYENYKNKYVFKNGARLTKNWENFSNCYLKIENKGKNHYFYINYWGFENKRMKLKKFRYSKNFKKIELCDWIPSKKFENYFNKMYSEYENTRNYIDSFFNITWHKYDELEYYN